jgi:hypothetical protein
VNLNKYFWIAFDLIQNPEKIVPALEANYNAWISKEYAKINNNKTKEDFIKSTVEILSSCTQNCSYELECCGCSIYAAVEKDKLCKNIKNESTRKVTTNKPTDSI